MHATQATERDADRAREATHIQACGKALNLILQAGGVRIAEYDNWQTKGDKRTGQTMAVYATRGGLVILSRLWMNGEVTGWDVYAPITKSNRVDETLAALVNVLEG